MSAAPSATAPTARRAFATTPASPPPEERRVERLRAPPPEDVLRPPDAARDADLRPEDAPDARDALALPDDDFFAAGELLPALREPDAAFLLPEDFLAVDLRDDALRAVVLREVALRAVALRAVLLRVDDALRAVLLRAPVAFRAPVALRAPVDLRVPVALRVPVDFRDDAAFRVPPVLPDRDLVAVPPADRADAPVDRVLRRAVPLFAFRAPPAFRVPPALRVAVPLLPLPEDFERVAMRMLLVEEVCPSWMQDLGTQRHLLASCARNFSPFGA